MAICLCFSLVLTFVILLSAPYVHTSAIKELIASHVDFKTGCEGSNAPDTNKMATIIETRSLPWLPALMTHFLATIDWPITAFVSTEVSEDLSSIRSLQRHIATGRLNLTVLPDWVDLSDVEKLSQFMTKPWFWQQFPEQVEWLFHFQSDSIICSRSEQSLDDWVGFDWVGAPWNGNPDSHGGNGGFSMRKRPSMLSLASSFERPENGPAEDLWFVQGLEKLEGTRWPSHQERFSLEHLYGHLRNEEPRSLGVHAGWKGIADWKDQSVLDRFKKWCPELKLFYDEMEWIR